MKTIRDKSVDMILTDLPFGTTDAEWDRKIDLEKLFKEYNRIIKDHGTIALFSQQPFSSELIQANRKYFRYEIIWQKTVATGFLNAKKMPLRIHENILIFYKKLNTYNPQKWKSKPYVRNSRVHSELYGTKNYCVTDASDGSRYPLDIVRFKNRFAGKCHSTEKPVDLLMYLINTYTDENDIVLDSCMGSGSCGEAALKCGRKFIGIEMNNEWYLHSCKRIVGVKNE